VRFIKADTEQGPRLGVVRPDGVAELARTESRLEPHFGDDGSALRALAGAIHADPAGEYGLDSLTLLKPVDPVSMRDFMVFEEHILPSWRRSGMSRGPDVWYEQPIGYFSNAATIRGPRDPIEIPGGSERLDFELEVGAVIGRETVSVTPAEAADRIAGFCILCDWSARDLQFREMDGRLGPFKGKDFGSSLGPVFVTPDELASRRRGNGYDLLMTSSVNGRQYGSDHWSSAYWSFEELISYASWNSRVEAGSIIGSGTCQGGCILELSARHSAEEYPWLTPGDEVTLSIELMGEIRARVLPPARGPWPGRKPAPEDPRLRQANLQAEFWANAAGRNGHLPALLQRPPEPAPKSLPISRGVPAGTPRRREDPGIFGSAPVGAVASVGAHPRRRARHRRAAGVTLIP
jgi:2-keto-4-pentenoate hydratase/2-oxohepta-3-ene-1,7-dioic acid hydratase in catechol pathway